MTKKIISLGLLIGPILSPALALASMVAPIPNTGGYDVTSHPSIENYRTLTFGPFTFSGGNCRTPDDAGIGFFNTDVQVVVYDIDAGGAPIYEAPTTEPTSTTSAPAITVDFSNLLASPNTPLVPGTNYINFAIGYRCNTTYGPDEAQNIFYFNYNLPTVVAFLPPETAAAIGSQTSALFLGFSDLIILIIALILGFVLAAWIKSLLSQKREK